MNDGAQTVSRGEPQLNGSSLDADGGADAGRRVDPAGSSGAASMSAVSACQRETVRGRGIMYGR